VVSRIMRTLLRTTSAAVALGLSFTALAACTQETADDDAAADEALTAAGTTYDPFKDIDPALGESLWPNEQKDIAATTRIITSFLQRRRAEGRTDTLGRVRTLRDAHAKAHGCVKAEVKVRSDVPADMKVGVFAQPKTYKAWIRFSNGNSEVRYDWKRDARGMAIKLTNVPGAKVVKDFPEQSTQDFVMINHPVFFVDNPSQYASTLEVFHSGKGFEVLGQLLSVTRLPLENAKLALAVNGTQIENPVAEPYWSMAAYKLGPNRAAKYASIPVACDAMDSFPRDRAAQTAWLRKAQEANESHLPSAHRDELRAAMQKTLEKDKKDVCYLFAMQPFVDLERTPIEHTTVNWDAASAFVPVANVRIPAQTFTSEAQDTFCDDMSFTPWHALPEHKPLGVVSRTRLIVYAATSKLRRADNGVGLRAALTGPTGDESF
jgi:hypothetical protein